jgi:hypothetical protein
VETTRSSLASSGSIRFALERRSEEERVAGADVKMLTGDGAAETEACSLLKSGVKSQ